MASSKFYLLLLTYCLLSCPSYGSNSLPPFVSHTNQATIWEVSSLIPTVLALDIPLTNWELLLSLLQTTCDEFARPLSGVHIASEFLATLCNCTTVVLSENTGRVVNVCENTTGLSQDSLPVLLRASRLLEYDLADISFNLSSSYWRDLSAFATTSTGREMAEQLRQQLSESPSKVSRSDVSPEEHYGIAEEHEPVFIANVTGKGNTSHPLSVNVAEAYSQLHGAIKDDSAPPRRKRFLGILFGLLGAGTGTAALVEVEKLRNEIAPVLEDVLSVTKHHQAALVAIGKSVSIILKQQSGMMANLESLHTDYIDFRDRVAGSFRQVENSMTQLDEQLRKVVSAEVSSRLVAELAICRFAYFQERAQVVEQVRRSQKGAPPSVLVDWKEVHASIVLLHPDASNPTHSLHPLEHMDWIYIGARFTPSFVTVTMCTYAVFGIPQASTEHIAWPVVSTDNQLLTTESCRTFLHDDQECEISRLKHHCRDDLSDDLLCFSLHECKVSDCCQSLLNDDSFNCTVSVESFQDMCYHSLVDASIVYLSGTCRVAILSASPDGVFKPSPEKQLLGSFHLRVGNNIVRVEGVSYYPESHGAVQSTLKPLFFSTAEIKVDASWSAKIEPLSLASIPWVDTQGLKEQAHAWLSTADNQLILAKTGIAKAEEDLAAVKVDLSDLSFSLVPARTLVILALVLSALATLGVGGLTAYIFWPRRANRAIYRYQRARTDDDDAYQDTTI